MGFKVLHLIDSGGLYGAEKMLLALMEEQINFGDSPTLLSVGSNEDADKHIEIEARKRKLPVVTWRMNPGLNIKESRSIATWAKQQRYQIIHTHGYKFNILMGIQKLLGFDVPLVSTVHGYLPSKPFEKLWLYQKLDGFFLRFLDRICVVSEQMKSLPVIRRLPCEHLTVVENGLPRNSHSQDPMTLESDLKRFLNGNSFNLLTVGRLSPEKNMQSLVRVLADVRIENLCVGLCIVGEGPERARLEELIERLGVNSRVRLLGYRSDVPDLMRYFDMLALASLTEGMPITIIEAMRVGLPVIATDVGGVSNMLDNGRAGHIVQPGSDDQMIHGLLNALNDFPKNKKISEIAKNQFLSRFSVEIMVKKYSEVYCAVLKS